MNARPRSDTKGGIAMPESNNSEPSSPSTPASRAPESAASSETRRDAVRRLGKYAAYTAPALMGLLAGTNTASAT
jgi:hypothetical protein